MLSLQDSTILDYSNICFGNMIKIENYKKELLPILKAFKEEQILINNGLLLSH